MRPDEIREYTDEQLRRRIGELQEELFRLRFRQSTMELENPMLIGEIRRDIARMKTIIRERELEEEAAGTSGTTDETTEAADVGVMAAES